MSPTKKAALARSTKQAPYRVLVVTEDVPLANLVELTLNHGRFIARTARDAEEATRTQRDWQAHLAVVQADLDPRVLDLRRSSPGGGPRVIALTRRGDLRTKLDAFDRGADDIVTVPFAPEELVARANALMSRAYRGQSPVIPTIRVGELEIDILERNVRVGRSVIHLTSLEQALLYLLAANAGSIVSHDAILDSLWGTDFIGETNVVERHIRGLRSKLQNDSRRPRYIETVRGKGYRFIPASSPGGPTAVGV